MKNNHHTQYLYKLRSEQTQVQTRVLVAPRLGKFVKGEVLTLHESPREQYSVTFLKIDGDRSFVNKNGTVVCCFTYKLSR